VVFVQTQSIQRVSQWVFGTGGGDRDTEFRTINWHLVNRHATFLTAASVINIKLALARLLLVVNTCCSCLATTLTGILLIRRLPILAGHRLMAIVVLLLPLLLGERTMRATRCLFRPVWTRVIIRHCHCRELLLLPLLT
jgi:hypothetical protein